MFSETRPQVPGDQVHYRLWSRGVQQGRQKFGESEKTHEEGRVKACFAEQEADDAETMGRTYVKPGGAPVSMVPFSELAGGSATES